MAKDTEITIEDFFKVRERITAKLKEQSRQEVATIRRTVEQLLELGYLDLAFVRDELADEKKREEAARESARRAREVANGAGQQKAAAAAPRPIRDEPQA